MANVQTAFGFRHIGYVGGGAPDYAQITRAIQSTYATVIGFQDPVTKVNATSLYIGQAVASQILNGTALLEGIFVGSRFPSTTLGEDRKAGWPGSTQAGDATAYIINSPLALFLVATLQTAIVTANIGQVVNFTTTNTSGTGASTTGGMFSNATIDQSTLGTSTSTTLPFKIVKLYDGIGNGSDPTTNFNWVVVRFNSFAGSNLAGF